MDLKLIIIKNIQKKMLPSELVLEVCLSVEIVVLVILAKRQI